MSETRAFREQLTDYWWKAIGNDAEAKAFGKEIDRAISRDELRHPTTDTLRKAAGILSQYVDGFELSIPDGTSVTYTTGTRHGNSLTWKYPGGTTVREDLKP